MPILEGHQVPLYGGIPLLSGTKGHLETTPVPLNLTFVMRSRAYILGKLVKTKFYRSVLCQVVVRGTHLGKPLNLTKSQSCVYRSWPGNEPFHTHYHYFPRVLHLHLNFLFCSYLLDRFGTKLYICWLAVTIIFSSYLISILRLTLNIYYKDFILDNMDLYDFNPIELLPGLEEVGI